VLSILLVITFIGAALFLVGYILYSSGKTILTLYPKYQNRLMEIYKYIADLFALPYNEHLSIIDNLWGQLGIRNQVRYLTISFSNSFFNFLKDMVMVLLFVVFLLLETVHLKEKIEIAFEIKNPSASNPIVTDVVLQVTRYLSIKFLFPWPRGSV